VDLSTDGANAPPSVGGNLSIVAGNGDNTFQPIDAQVTGNVSITLGTGSNTVKFASDSAIGGTLTWESGNGNDNLFLAAPQVYVVNAQFGDSTNTVSLDNLAAVLAGSLKGVGKNNVLAVEEGLAEQSPILTLTNFQAP
jgi:hypothetical protein